MKNKKVNSIVTILIITTIILVGIVIFILNYTKDNTSLSIVEKKWITNNINNVIDVNVYNDIPIYGYNGNGIIFDYLNNFTNEYNINFNKISYYTTDIPTYGNISFKILGNEEKITDTDILLYKDNYVVLSKEIINIPNLNSLDNQAIGILASDITTITNYLKDNKSIKTYKDMDALVLALNNKEVSYIITPNMMYMDKILSNNLNITYHISDLNKKYVLSVKDETIYNIMNKYYTKYLETNYEDTYSKEFLNIYFTSTKTDEVSKKNYNGVIYKYGYVVNMPYENNANNSFVGTISNYLSNFEKVTDIEIKVTRYESIDELKNALVSKEIDFALTNFDHTNLNLNSITTSSFKNEEYVVLSKDDISINSIKGLKDYEVSLIGSSNIYTLCSGNNIPTKIYKDTNDLIRNIDTNSIVIMDEDTYIYYKDGKLKDYKVILRDTIDNSYKFIVNKDYQTFASLLNYYISSSNYNDIKYKYNTDIMLEEENTNLKIVILIIILIIILIVTFLIINKKRAITNNMNKEDRLKYIDPMTSLKNRNYLNHNIYKWDDNVIFPQSIIVMDINKVKEINDRLGREAGDEIIKKVASILINNQLENTDIIRSGGDEFLIYMVGYEEKEVVEYTKKLAKLMKNIPDCEGIEIGYSMIQDEVKTIDDAINESILMVTKNKEKK